MKNDYFTSLSCLQFPCDFDLDGLQSTDSEISMMIGSHSGYLGTGSTDYNYYQHLISDGSLDIPSQFPYFSPVTCPSIMSTRSEDIGLASLSPLMDYQYSLQNDPSTESHTLLVQPSDHQNMKEPKTWTPGATLGQRNTVTSNLTSLEASLMSKKRKAMEQPINTRHLKTPNLRRSQKLSDKISALQEIVCPYGKTDTASVLQETCIYITVFHQELRRLCVSYFETRSFQSQQQSGVGRQIRQSNLQSKGLCLVPISIMKSLTRESWIDQQQTTASGKLRRHRII